MKFTVNVYLFTHSYSSFESLSNESSAFYDIFYYSYYYGSQLSIYIFILSFKIFFYLTFFQILLFIKKRKKKEVLEKTHQKLL